MSSRVAYGVSDSRREKCFDLILCRQYVACTVMQFVKFAPILAGLSLGIWRALALNAHGHGLAAVSNCFALMALGFLVTLIWTAHKA